MSPTGPTLATLVAGETVHLAAGHERSVHVVEGTRPSAGAVLVRLRGIGTREGAAALTGGTIEVEAARLVALADPDEVYVRDLVGCAVTAGRRPLGRVVDVHPGAANDALVVRVDGEGTDLLVPFTRDAITAFDLAARRIELREDLLEP